MDGITLYTIGHSDRSLDELLTMLLAERVAMLVDVRAQPHSSRHPQFSSESLRAAVDGAGMLYHWAGRQLGGRRPSLPQSRHRALDEEVRGYADYMESADFQRAAAQLVNMGSKSPSAILCAERRPEDCHRNLIADYLTLQAVRVVHLVNPGEQREHQLSASARRESSELVYDRNVSAELGA